ncbi:sterol desaturase family protein [Verrucomicrobiota bacterium sgz303538]
MLISKLPNFTEITVGTFVDLGIRYGLFAGAAWLLCYVFFRRRWFHRKIVARFPAPREVRRELAYSMLALVIFGLSGAITIEAAKRGHTQLYWRISQHGWPWFWLSIGATILLHDAWFYWTHRLMHQKRLFPYFHRIHHLSHNPSPWAAYAFDPLESVVHAALFPIAATVMPLHPFAFGIFMFWQTTYNVLGHAGYEFHPRWLMDTWLGRILNTPTNHIMHHEKMRGNYGLYFNVWDRLMGTNHRDYEDRFREVTSRRRDAHSDPTAGVEPAPSNVPLGSSNA